MSMVAGGGGSVHPLSLIVECVHVLSHLVRVEDRTDLRLLHHTLQRLRQLIRLRVLEDHLHECIEAAGHGCHEHAIRIRSLGVADGAILRVGSCDGDHA